MNDQEWDGFMTKLLAGLTFEPTGLPRAEPDCECGGYWIVERNWYTGEVDAVYYDTCGSDQE